MKYGLKHQSKIRKLWNRVRLEKKKRYKLRGTVEDRFTRIYRHNWWSSAESRSGTGSELAVTRNLRSNLPTLMRDYNVTRFLDAPCGDFNWMQHALPDLGVEYIGGDIVKELTVRNQREFGGEGVSFVHLDIIKDRLPQADLMMVRDCLIHFSYMDIYRFVENFCSSEIPLLLTTTVLPDDGRNSDIKTGEWRMLHLFSPPLCFPKEPLCRIRDWEPPHPIVGRREMCLFTKAQIENAGREISRCLVINRRVRAGRLAT